MKKQLTDMGPEKVKKPLQYAKLGRSHTQISNQNFLNLNTGSQMKIITSTGFNSSAPNVQRLLSGLDL